MSRPNGTHLPSYRTPPPATSVIGSIAHPHRALPPGKQWAPHCGARQRARALRQQRLKALKELQRTYSSSIVTGREGDALLLDLPGPTRILEQQE